MPTAAWFLFLVTVATAISALDDPPIINQSLVRTLFTSRLLSLTISPLHTTSHHPHPIISSMSSSNLASTRIRGKLGLGSAQQYMCTHRCCLTALEPILR